MLQPGRCSSTITRLPSSYSIGHSLGGRRYDFKGSIVKIIVFYRTGNPHFPNIRSYNATLHFYNSTCLDGYIKVHHCNVIEFELKLNVFAYLTTCGLLHHVKQYQIQYIKSVINKIFTSTCLIFCAWGSLTGGRRESGRVCDREERHGRRI